MAITEFFLKDVRCFAGEHRFCIRPLTFVVGENSTGKSTILGSMQALSDWSHSYRSDRMDFNIPPYQLGSFREIARKSRPLNTRFQLGMALEEPECDYRVTLSEHLDGTEPVVGRQEWNFPDFRVVLEPKESEPFPDGNLFNIRKEETPYGLVHRIRSRVRWPILDAFSLRDYFEEASIRNPPSYEDPFDFSHDKNFKMGRGFDEFPFSSLAPVRSEPRRTYDPVAEISEPGGADIPVFLMNIARNNRRNWQELQERLVEFGKDSGLFTDIQIRQFGESSSNPFQVRIKAQGPMVNLIDTGYGVSQVLPILVHVFRARNRWLLIQQPEVHLHPRGQAALASLLIQRLGKKDRRKSFSVPGFVIETHSDYLIDRTRIEIAQGKIEADDVSLIYLENAGTRGVRTHNISFDKMGNMKQVPHSYRRFFLKETDRLLGFES